RHVRYPASSSLRAWTLTLPSVVFRIALSSLKLSDGLTASALTMPRRGFSWIRRSKSGISAGRGAGAGASLRAGLATVSPCDEDSEDDVQAAEAATEQRVGDGERREGGGQSEEHEADTHDGNHADRERAAADEGRAVEQQPRRRHRRECAGAV